MTLDGARDWHTASRSITATRRLLPLEFTMPKPCPFCVHQANGSTCTDCGQTVSRNLADLTELLTSIASDEVHAGGDTQSAVHVLSVAVLEYLGTLAEYAARVAGANAERLHALQYAPEGSRTEGVYRRQFDYSTGVLDALGYAGGNAPTTPLSRLVD